MMERLSFSGHESFTCKQFWLKKGVDFVVDKQNSFAQDQAVVMLGVGKNMVRAIRFWLKSFGITDDNDEISTIGAYLFHKERVDPFLESIGSIWLLHYLLVKVGKASIYDLVFNTFRRMKPEFKFEHLESYIERYCNTHGGNNYNENTVKRDIRVFLNNYLPPNASKRTELEDSYSGLLYELRLVKEFTKVDTISDEKITLYSIDADFRDSLPWQIVLYSILDNEAFGSSITFQDLYAGKNAPGSVFALSQEGLYQKILDICHALPDCSYSETAGNRVLQIPKTIDKMSILNDYYQY
jgi:hypothetical protein